MGRRHDLPEAFMIQCCILQKCRDMLGTSDVSGSGCIWKWAEDTQLLVQGWGTCLGCVCAFHAIPVDQLSAFGTAVPMQVSRWEGCGWISQAAPVNRVFLTCRKVLVRQTCAVLASIQKSRYAGSYSLFFIRKGKPLCIYIYFLWEVLFVSPFVIVVQEMAVGPLPWHHLFSLLKANNLQC